MNQSSVESFSLDHRKVKAPYVRHAGIKKNKDGAIVEKFDVRLAQPNAETVPGDALHSLEHFLATYLRDELEGLIDISPMGCRTGFYLILWDEHSSNEIATAIENAMKKVLVAENLISATEIECGNYREHSLEGAKKYAEKVLKEGISRDPFQRIFE